MSPLSLHSISLDRIVMCHPTTSAHLYNPYSVTCPPLLLCVILPRQHIRTIHTVPRVPCWLFQNQFLTSTFISQFQGCQMSPFGWSTYCTITSQSAPTMSPLSLHAISLDCIVMCHPAMSSHLYNPYSGTSPLLRVATHPTSVDFFLVGQKL
jgi:hypothetical protein